MSPRIVISLSVSFALAAGCAPAPTASGPIAPAAAGWEMPELPQAAPISAAEYSDRRARLAEAMDDGVFVALGGATPVADYMLFHQTPTFRYLTGITEPAAALVIEKRDGRVEETLFVADRDPSREVWEGPRLGPAGAQRLTGVRTRTVDRLLPALDSLLADAETLYTPVPGEDAPPLADVDAERRLLQRLTEANPRLDVRPLGPVILQMRAHKSATELDMIRRAVYITVLAHRAAMRTMEPGMNEFEVQALIEYTFRRYGAERPGFASIVGSGPKATTLHYNANDRFMSADDMVVMDIGASYRGYSADVTRSVPVDGRFSTEQREIYQIVRDAQSAAESVARPGAGWPQLNAAADSVIAHGLAELGLIESADATYRCESPRFGVQCPQYRLYYMHGLGHGIGLEVHDPEISYYGTFAPGSAFTIEPGIYIRADALDYLPDTPENRAMADRLRPVLQRYRNIGVRIEDDYIVTEDGLEHVSAGAPREIAEIEALMSQPPASGDPRLPAVVEWYRATTPR